MYPHAVPVRLPAVVQVTLLSPMFQVMSLGSATAVTVVPKRAADASSWAKSSGSTHRPVLSWTYVLPAGDVWTFGAGRASLARASYATSIVGTR